MAATESADAECPHCDRAFKNERGLNSHIGHKHSETVGEEISCEVCGERFEVYDYESERRMCCSQECKAEKERDEFTGEDNPRWAGGESELSCAVCGDVFYVKPSREDEARYCSQECQHNAISSKEKLSCERCGDEFKRSPSRVPASQYCSQTCYYKECRGSGEKCEQFSYGPNWSEQSKRARRRDQYRCQVCGVTQPKHVEKYGQKLHVHHITPIRNFRDGDSFDYECANVLSNLLSVCCKCHRKVEQISPLSPTSST